MSFSAETVELGLVLAQYQGRLDAFAAKAFGAEVEALDLDSVLVLILDLEGVTYLSSAGLRVFAVARKKLRDRGGSLILLNIQDYLREVIEISGMGALFPQFTSRDEAIEHGKSILREREIAVSWNDLEQLDLPEALIHVLPGDENASGVVELYGDVKQILHADATEEDVASRTFCETEYSIGCGGLGHAMEDYFPIMGEMITIGGTMVWLPTDGNDTPDFLIPRRSNNAVTIRTVFNAAIEGGFHEFFQIESKLENGIAIDTLYELLFATAKKRRPDYRGVIGLAARAEFSEVYGSGISKSPIRRFRPANGETIIHPSNIAEWFAGDQEPRLRNVTGLLCGIGIDLTADLSAFNPAHVDQAFYRHPDNTGERTHLLHNHAAFFSPQPMPRRCINLDHEIQTVVENGDFCDMRHLLDQSRISRAFVGISYAQEIRLA